MGWLEEMDMDGIAPVLRVVESRPPAEHQHSRRWQRVLIRLTSRPIATIRDMVFRQAATEHPGGPDGKG